MFVDLVDTLELVVISNDEHIHSIFFAVDLTIRCRGPVYPYQSHVTN